MSSDNERRFRPRICTKCTSVWQPGDAKPYVTRSGSIDPNGYGVRYCKCGFCGHTWTQWRTYEGPQHPAITLKSSTKRGQSSTDDS